MISGNRIAVALCDADFADIIHFSFIRRTNIRLWSIFKVALLKHFACQVMYVLSKLRVRFVRKKIPQKIIQD